MSEGDPRPDKQDVARALLLRGSVFVYLDPRDDGVRVPPWLAKQPQLVLQFGLDLPVPIPDMRVDSAGVSGTLSFNRQPFVCSVPWRAVFALVGDDGMGMVWEEDLPEEIAAEVQTGFERRAEKRPALRAIDGGKAAAAPAEALDARAKDDAPHADQTDADQTDADRTDAGQTDAGQTDAAPQPPDSEPPPDDAPAAERGRHLRLIK